ncbi:Beta-glucosidase cel3A [Tulasnella sp. 417]|nr:Beta-glucosidase cel3A [Tulasnella sp. 417]
MKYSIASLAALAWTVTTVDAAVPMWGQCGGIGYTAWLEPPPPPPPPPLPALRPPAPRPRLRPPPPAPLRLRLPLRAPPRRQRPPPPLRSRLPAPAEPSATLTNLDTPPTSGDPYYVAEVNAAIAAASSSTLAAKFPAVAKVPNFTWFDVVAKVPTLTTYLADAASIASKIIVQIVVYDLPDRDCHALASNGEFKIANNGVANYKGYIDGIAAAVSAYPQVRVVAVVEPDSLANLVTNMSDSRCANAQSAYLECTKYALEKLKQCNIWLYLDAGHGGWLGWAANQDPAATLFANVYKGVANNRVRGLATNVANYNPLQLTVSDPVTQGNPTPDELSYVRALGPKLTSNGFPAHFIVDQGRSGVEKLRDAWGNWCNIEGAGFGMRPTTNTPDALIDAIVWIKPGGECDGTSNTSAVRYDSTCGLADAKKPAPEAGQWFQAYFEDLVKYANPAF